MTKKLSDLIGQFATIPNSFIAQSVALSTEAKWLFVILRYHTNSKTGNAFPSYTKISEMTGFHRKTISKSLRELEAAGWLTKQRRFGATTIYALQIPSSSISDTTEPASSSLNSTISSAISATVSSSDGAHTNQTEEETRLKEPDRVSSPHSRLMDFLQTRNGPIANGSKEGKAIKWLLEHGYDPEQCMNCFDYLAAQEWRTTAVDWVTVQTNIGAWINRNGNSHRPILTPPITTRVQTAQDFIAGFEKGLKVAPNYDISKDIAAIKDDEIRKQVNQWWMNQNRG